MSTVAELNERIERLEKVVLGMKKEIGTLRAGDAPEVPKGDCIKGQDADDCPFAGTYRYQKGCRGASCKRANSEYYNKPKDTPVEPPAKKKAPAKAAATKKTAKPLVPAPAKKVAAATVKKGLLKRA